VSGIKIKGLHECCSGDGWMTCNNLWGHRRAGEGLEESRCIKRLFKNKKNTAFRSGSDRHPSDRNGSGRQQMEAAAYRG
jgi:hypothetical protein